jgi:hypothetical protein
MVTRRSCQGGLVLRTAIMDRVVWAGFQPAVRFASIET